MREILVLASRNRKKRKEMEQILGDLPVVVRTLDDFPEVPDPVEDGRTFLENAGKKAFHVAEQTGHYALADDSGLEVDALGGTPGVLSARYAGQEDHPERDRLNNEKLLTALAGVPVDQRTARFRCAIVLAGPPVGGGEGIVVYGSAEGSVEGRILEAPRGEGGFGYDPLFYHPESGRTFSEIAGEEKNRLSHRGRALQAMIPILAGLFGSTGKP